MPPERMAVHGHHWEIGFEGFGARTVRKSIRRSGWSIENEMRVAELPWHHFFLLKKMDGAG